MRLIDGDAFKDLMMSLAYDDWNQGVNTSLADAFRVCARRAEEAPTVDAVPVVHGHWVFKTDRRVVDGYDWQCNQCKSWQRYTSNFCPNCGARMDGDHHG